MTTFRIRRPPLLHVWRSPPAPLDTLNQETVTLHHLHRGPS